jgi:hypothetical protein
MEAVARLRMAYSGQAATPLSFKVLGLSTGDCRWLILEI